MRNTTFAISAVVAAIFATSVSAADLIIEDPVLPTVEAATMDWTGPYLGAHVGYGAGTVNWSTLPTGFFTGDYEVDGWLAGVQGGYNWQFDSFVLGVDASIEWTDISGVDDNPAISREINWAGALRGKAGVAFDSLLVYGAAGFAFANSTGTSVFSSEDTQTHTGWTVGVGIEAMVTDSMSLFAEYSYTQYGWEDYDYAIDTETEFDTSALKAGINFHF